MRLPSSVRLCFCGVLFLMSACELTGAQEPDGSTSRADSGSTLEQPDAGLADAGSEAIDAGQPDAGQPDAGLPDAGQPDAGQPDAGQPDAGLGVDGIIFVHGVNGSSADWSIMLDRFRADGWPDARLIARTYADPRFGCNATNAMQLSQWVQELAGRGASRIAIVAHSMGGLSSRYYLQRMGGTSSVVSFVTLGTMHHGLSTSCLSPLPVCVWQEVCESGAFITDINSPPATPGPTKWVSIFSTGDQTVPAASSRLVGALNIELQGLAHDGANGLQNSPLVYQHVKDAL